MVPAALRWVTKNLVEMGRLAESGATETGYLTKSGGRGSTRSTKCGGYDQGRSLAQLMSGRRPGHPQAGPLPSNPSQGLLAEIRATSRPPSARQILAQTQNYPPSILQGFPLFGRFDPGAREDLQLIWEVTGQWLQGHP